VSSKNCAAELTPDPRLRRLVIGSGVAAAAAGAGLTWSWHLPVFWRLLAASCWLASCSVELRRIVQGYRRYRRIRVVSDGSVELRVAGGPWVAASVRPGTVVLPRIAWLRFAVRGGPGLAELVRGESGENEAWRRFQVIWRHLGGAA
jgi:hypothetical protein